MGRYDDVETADHETTTAEGNRRRVRYYRRRPLPPPVPAEPTAGARPPRHTVLPDDRLDLLSALYTGDPAGFWRLCDANAALDPEDLTGPEAVGTEIVIPLPGVGGR